MNSRLSAAAVSAAIVVSVFSSCTDKSPKTAASADSSREALPVSVMRIEESSFTVMGEYYGAAQPIVGAILRAPAGGRVDAILAADGARVRKGDSLGSVALAAAEAQHRTAVLNERLASEAYRRQKDFFASGSAARVAVDQAELAWNAAQNALIQAEEVLRGARCETPLDGTVLSRSVELYDELAPGSPTFSVGDLSRLRIEIGIPESDIGGASVGSAAVVSFTAFPGVEFKATVSSVDRELSPRSLTFGATVILDNPGERIPPGVTAKVTLPRRSFERAVAVPSESLLNETEGAYAMVALRRESGWIARKIPVTTGPAGAGSTVVRTGLSNGDFLIVDGNHLAEDGAAVSFDERLALAGKAREN